MKHFMWYFFVAFTSIVLLIAFVQKSVIATILAALLCAILKKTGGNVELPDIYKRLGVAKKFFTK